MVVDDDRSVVVVVVDDDVVVVWLEAVVPAVSTTSWGAVAPVSRLAYRADLLSVVSTTSSRPSPRTSPVMSTLV